MLKRLFAAATVLLVVGVGCPIARDASAPAEEGIMKKEGGAMPAPSGTEGMKEGANTTEGGDVDAAVGAYLEAAAEEQAAAEQEDADASLLNATDAELNSYGQAYDDGEF